MIPDRPLSRTARFGRIVSLASQGYGVDDIQVRTGEPYWRIAIALRAGPLARLARARAYEQVRRTA